MSADESWDEDWDDDYEETIFGMPVRTFRISVAAVLAVLLLLACPSGSSCTGSAGWQPRHTRAYLFFVPPGFDASFPKVVLNSLSIFISPHCTQRFRLTVPVVAAVPPD